MKKKNIAFNVMVKINLDTTVTIVAESLEDAIAKGKELGVRDVVEFEGDFADGGIEVTGVFK